MHRSVWLVGIIVACNGSPVERLEVPPDPSRPLKPPKLCENTPPEEAGGHASNDLESIYEEKALFELLLARQYHRYVYKGYDPTMEQAVSLLLHDVCGLDAPGTDDCRRRVIESATIDELFPPNVLFKARGVRCGSLELCDGTIYRGKGVTWD
jgi:hypothetical protein